MGEKDIEDAIAENIRLGLMEEVAPGYYQVTAKGADKIRSMIERESHRTAKPILREAGKA